MPKVSIIVPAYNEGARIIKCLNSLVNQTFSDIEIVVVDDGSTDDTLDILNNYNNDKLVILSKENGGQGSARNLALKKSKGEYIMFVDADDYVDETIVEKLYNSVLNENADISVCDIYKVINGKTYIFNNFDYFTSDNVLNLMMSHPGPVARLYKKDLFIKNNIYFVEGKINEDLGTIPLLGIYANKVSYIKEPLYYYIIHDNSTTKPKKYNKKLEDIFYILEYLTDEFNKRSNEKYKDVLEYLYIEHLLYSASLIFMSFDEGIEQINKIRKIIKKKFFSWKHNKFYKQKSIKFKLICNLIYSGQLWIVKKLKKFRK
ncbi:MAG: glycosyltransferase [Bacilli bacterium]|nr:glycosyltransferase [Bacilli bacterium]